jgi:hypothetical protein
MCICNEDKCMLTSTKSHKEIPLICCYISQSITMTLGSPFAHIYLTKFPIHSLYAIKNITKCNIHPLGLIFLQHMVKTSMSTIKTNCQTYWQGCIEIHLIHNIETKWNKTIQMIFLISLSISTI